MPKAEAEPLDSPEDLSERLGIPIKTLYKWRSAGDGPRAMKIGRHLRYRRADVDRWLEQQQASSAR